MRARHHKGRNSLSKGVRHKNSNVSIMPEKPIIQCPESKVFTLCPTKRESKISMHSLGQRKLLHIPEWEA